MNRRRFIQFVSGSLVVTGKVGSSIASIKNITSEEASFLSDNNLPGRLILGYYSDRFRLEKGRVTVIASRPFVGESNLLQNIIQDVSMSQNISIGYYSLIRKPLLLERMVDAQQILGASNIYSALESACQLYAEDLV